MQKQLTQLEAKIGEKTYQFVCDPDSPLAHVKEALFQFVKHVMDIQSKIEAERVPPSEQDVADQETKNEA